MTPSISVLVEDKAWLRLLPASRRLGRDVISLQAFADAAHRYRQRHRAAAPTSSEQPESD